jgi:hypothetical protein
MMMNEMMTTKMIMLKYHSVVIVCHVNYVEGA